MRRHLLGGYTACILAILAASLGGCGSTPASRFYHLDSLAGGSGTGQAAQGGKMVVAIGPVRIPDYLDRPQIITRRGENEFRLSEFDRWAGSLENDIVRVLSENVSAQLPPSHYLVIRWSPLLESQIASSYRVELIVNRFEGELDGQVVLKAQWGIFSDGKFILHNESRIAEPVAGKDYSLLVRAMSAALEKLSRDIAAEITSLGGQGGERTSLK